MMLMFIHISTAKKKIHFAELVFLLVSSDHFLICDTPTLRNLKNLIHYPKINNKLITQQNQNKYNHTPNNLNN